MTEIEEEQTEQTTVCTRCCRTKAVVARHAPNTYGARCRHDPMGEHKWRTFPTAPMWTISNARIGDFGRVR